MPTVTHKGSAVHSSPAQMDDPGDDPRHSDASPPFSFIGDQDYYRNASGEGGPPVAGGMGNILELISTMMRPPAGDQPRSLHATRMGHHGYGGERELGNGMRIVLNTPGTVRFGGTPTPGQLGFTHGRDGTVPRLSEHVAPSIALFPLSRPPSFLASTTGSPNPAANEHQTRTPAPLLASYILSNLMGGRDTMVDPFEMMARGRYGDFVVNEQGKSRLFLSSTPSVGVGGAVWRSPTPTYFDPGYLPFASVVSLMDKMPPSCLRFIRLLLFVASLSFSISPSTSIPLTSYA